MNKIVHIVDDHLLFSQSLEILISQFPGYSVGFCAQNGVDLIHRLQDKSFNPPDIVLLDIRMPIMNGLETMEWLKSNYPELPVLALSMEDDDATIIQMLRKGVRGYLLKDVHPTFLKKALEDTLLYGFFQNEKVNKVLLGNLSGGHSNLSGIKERELDFIKLACTELTYKEIALEMSLSPKTIDGYREALFEKLNIKSRVGLVMFAIKNKIISI